MLFMDLLTLTYKRSKGLRLVYEIEADESRYRILQNGELLRDAPAPTPPSHINVLEATFKCAIDDIEKLTGMAECPSEDDPEIQPI